MSRVCCDKFPSVFKRSEEFAATPRDMIRDMSAVDEPRFAPATVAEPLRDAVDARRSDLATALPHATLGQGDLMEILIIAVIIGLLPAAIAHSRGHSFFAWWFFGAALWIVAFPMSLFLKRDVKSLDQRAVEAGGSKKCPECAEIVKADAKVCRFCQHRFVVAPAGPQAASGETDSSLG